MDNIHNVDQNITEIFSFNSTLTSAGLYLLVSCTWTNFV